VTLGYVFLPVFLFSPVSIIPPFLHTHLHLHVALTGGASGQNLAAFRNAMLFFESGSTGSKSRRTLKILNFKPTLSNTILLYRGALLDKPMSKGRTLKRKGLRTRAVFSNKELQCANVFL
jgi:hypothetical protein